MTIPSRGSDGALPAPVDPRLRLAMHAWLVLGVCAVAVLPAARGDSTWLGWLPMWLVLMPASACWALHRFRLPRWRRPGHEDASRRRHRRRRHAQARRLRRTDIRPRGVPRVA